MKKILNLINKAEEQCSKNLANDMNVELKNLINSNYDNKMKIDSEE